MVASSPHFRYRNHGLLWRALGLSLLLHALLLLQPGNSSQTSNATAPKTLMALLRTRVANSPVAAPVVPSPSHVVASHKDHLAAKSSVAMIAAPSAVNATDVSASSHVTMENSTTQNSGSAADISVLDFDENKKSYLFAIAAEARRVKKYPQRALTAGWTGTADIRITVAAAGNVLPPKLQKSSGYADIDNAALSLVGIALKRTPVPQKLRGRAFELMLPVSFNINDE